jgi:hypothetical protein
VPEQGSAAHSGRDADPEQLQDRRRDVEEVHPLAGAPFDPRAGHDQQPVLGMVRVVGPGVVLEGVDSLVASDVADGAPEQVAEVDDQVGCDPPTCSYSSSGLWTRVSIGLPFSSGIASSLRARSSRTRS